MILLLKRMKTAIGYIKTWNFARQCIQRDWILQTCHIISELVNHFLWNILVCNFFFQKIDFRFSFQKIDCKSTFSFGNVYHPQGCPDLKKWSHSWRYGYQFTFKAKSPFCEPITISWDVLLMIENPLPHPA